MYKSSFIIWVILLLLATGCSVSITQPANMAEAIASPTIQTLEKPSAASGGTATPTTAISPTFTPTLLENDPTATSTATPTATEEAIVIEEVTAAEEITVTEKMTITEEIAVTEEKKKPALFFFYADWCSACSQMRPVIENLEPEYSDRIRFFMVDVDKPESRELVMMVGVRAIPLTIFITAPDQEAQRWVGPRPEEVLRAAFDEALSHNP